MLNNRLRPSRCAHSHSVGWNGYNANSNCHGELPLVQATAGEHDQQAIQHQRTVNTWYSLPSPIE